MANEMLKYVLLISVSLVSIGLASIVASQDRAESRVRWKFPHANQDFLGFVTCVKCHEAQLNQLKKTKHFVSFDVLHRTAEAKEYCRQLDLRTIKRTARCVRCHYTPEFSSSGRLKAGSGISCENCHGPAKSWLKFHNDYGSPQATKENESIAHRDWRVATSIDIGMRHPSNVFLLARSCYDCHLVDDEELVTKTAHTPLTKNFNFISFSQGQMRHNFYRTQDKGNAVSDLPRQRLMYLADLVAACEQTIDAISQTPTREGRYFESVVNLLLEKRKKLEDAAKRTQNPLVTKAIQLVDEFFQGKLDGGTVTEQLKNVGYSIGAGKDLTGLEQLDAVIPGAGTYVK